MIEDINNNTEIELHYTDPPEHVKVMLDILPKEEVEDYFTKYATDMSEDSINCFYGGSVRFQDPFLTYNKEKSEEYVQRVKDRLGWIVGFEHTPLSIREVTEEFLEEFNGKSLSSAKEWTEVVDEWVSIIRPLAREVRGK
ncbi:MAG: hypothetical protein WCR68_02645 [Candidatus Dojkabacteria bacterium]